MTPRQKMTRLFALLLPVILIIQSTNSIATGATPLTVSLADELVLYAMMSSNTYVDEKERQFFPIEKLGWRKVDLEGKIVQPGANSYEPKSIVGHALSSLQFDIWEEESSNRTVFAFKGTDELSDWLMGNMIIGISIAYKSAKKHVREYKTMHPGRSVTVTGHSLGGGLALSVSAWEGDDAFVFNTSPRIFDGMREIKKRARRIALFQKDEILQDLRKVYPKFLSMFGASEIVESQFDYGGRELHRIDLLAEGLIACSSAPNMRNFRAGRNLSVRCYLQPVGGLTNQHLAPLAAPARTPEAAGNARRPSHAVRKTAPIQRFTSSSSITKFNVLSGGIRPGTPRLP